jgi:hypothetical protein
LTFFNDTAQTQSGTWKIDPAVLHLTGKRAMRSLISGKILEPHGEGWPIVLAPQRVEVIELRSDTGRL